MATIRQRRTGVWEVRVFTGRDERGRPTQVSRTVYGGKKEAQRVAAELTALPAARSGGRTVSDLLAEWFALNEDTWAASSRRDRASRVEFINADPIAKVAVARLSVADVERWIARMRKAGIGEGAIRNRHQTLRAAMSQAVRWGWIAVNPAGLAQIRQPKRAPRGAMTPHDVQRVLEAAATIDPAAVLALRLAAITGARRSELAALRWTDLDGDRLVVDSAIETVRTGHRGAPGVPTLSDVANKTANRRTIVLDSSTVSLANELRHEREAFGSWMFAIGDRAPNPDRVGAWWRLARKRAGIDPAWRLRDRPRPRRALRRQPARPRRPVTHAARVHRRARVGRPRRGGHARCGTRRARRRVSPLVLRHEEPPADAVVIIRGGLLANDSIVRTATTSFERHGFYGVSVFAAIGMTIEELVARTPELGADRYKQLRRSTVGELRAAAFALLPTLDWPHFDIVLPDVDVVTLDRLAACFSEPFTNPAGAMP